MTRKPMSAEVRSLATFVRSGRRVTFACWMRRTIDLELMEISTSAAKPSAELRAAFEQLNCEVPLEAGRLVVRHLELTDHWQVRIHIDSQRSVRFVRLGSRLAVRTSPPDESHWIVELKDEGTEAPDWIAALCSPFVVLFSDGTEIEFPGLPSRVSLDRSS